MSPGDPNSRLYLFWNYSEEYYAMSSLCFAASFCLPKPSSLIFHGIEYNKGHVTARGLLPSTLKGLWQVSYTFGGIRGLHFYKPSLFLVGTDQAGRWVKRCETAGKGAGKSSRIFACYCFKSFFAALERLLGRLLHEHTMFV